MQKYVNHNYFSNIDTESKAYFIGLLLADGNINKRRGEYTIVNLHLSQRDIDIIHKFKYYTDSDNTIFIGDKNNDCALRITSRQMVKDLSNYGIVPRKTGNENPNFSNIPQDLLRHTIRGLFEGDGWYSLYEHNGKLISSVGLCGSFNTCNYIQNLFHNILGLNTLKVSKVKDKDCYKIDYSSHNQGIAIIKWLYKDASVFIQRKRDNAERFVTGNIFSF